MVHEFDHLRPRFVDVGVDLWGGPSPAAPIFARRIQPAGGDGMAMPPAARLHRVCVKSVRRHGDPKHASRAARTFVEFIESQLSMVEAGGQASKRKPRRVDPRLWLDDRHWLSWTTCGELVSVEEIEPGSMRGSPEVRRLEVHELPAVFAADRLIPSVIALYSGDQLKRGAVHRYIAHYDLRRALEAAQGCAEAEEARLRAEASLVAASQPSSSATPRVVPMEKTRHHPLGNFIVYRRPRADEGLPDYAAVMQLIPVPEAFADRRTATRFLARMPRLGLDPTGLVVARVVGSVEARPVFRPGIAVSREPEAILDVIRREPRIVMPELKAVWLPRYVQEDDGTWQLERVQKRGTVRARWNRILLRRVADEGRRFAEMLEESAIRERAGAEEVGIGESLATTLRLVQRAERRLPEAWLDQLGMQRESIAPDWQALAKAGPVADVGHWLRAPCEHGRPHNDGQRRRIVELLIADLAGLLEVAGMRPRFLLVKESTIGAPRWVWECSPELATSERPEARCHTSRTALGRREHSS